MKKDDGMLLPVQQNQCLSSQGNLSLQNDIVLAIASGTAKTLSFDSIFSGQKVTVTASSLFICQNFEAIAGTKENWLLKPLSLSRLIEILAIVDVAIGKSLLQSRTKSSNKELFFREAFSLPDYALSKTSIDDIVVGFILREHQDFSIWCEVLRKYEAYGMMCFLLSATDEHANINQLSRRYGLSTPYFRQLYRESFNATAKKKLMDVRMASAILKLIESESSVLDIGLNAGYCSASHFTNDLKKELGLTPSEIRRLETMLYEN